MKIVITGPKCCGKSTVGAQIAARLGIPFIETDTLIEQAYERQYGQSLPFHKIFERVGECAFREYEQHAVVETTSFDWCVISVGGSTLLHPESRKILRQNSVMVLLRLDAQVLWERLKKLGKSKYLKTPSPQERFQQRVQLVMEVVEPYADIVVEDVESKPITEAVLEKLQEYFATLTGFPNTFGQLVRLTTFGESHGPAVGAVLDGLRPGIELSAEDIQSELDRRRPGQSKVSTPRNEPDRVRILSGVFEGKTTGTPVALLIENRDQDSARYEEIRNLFRPGHADFTFWKKYGVRDHRGGGRSSGRETAARVAGGAAAKKLLADRGVRITGFSLEIAGIRAASYDSAVIESNSVRCADATAAEKMQQAILDARRDGDSVGGIVELRIQGVPAGLGDPVFGKLDARLAQAFCSLGAVKAIEFGDGISAAGMRGSEFNDPMHEGRFLSNHAGGILGGISTGQEIVVRLAVKPTPSISKPQKTCDTNNRSHEISIEGRHDPCIVPRIIPVVEAMAALVILDTWEIQERIRPGWHASAGE
jgi:chorismate synthase